MENNSLALLAASGMKLYDWKWNEGYALLQRALAVNPNDPMGHLLASEYQMFFMNQEKELEHARMGYLLDPLSANAVGEAARHYLFAGKIKEAMELAEEALELDPNNLISRNVRAYATAIAGNPQDALQQALETHRITGDHPLVLMAIGYMYAQLDKKEKVRGIISQFNTIMQNTPEVNLDFAVAFLCAQLGDKDALYQAYDRGIAKKSIWVAQFYGSILLQTVWYDEHIIASRKKLGLPVKEKK